MSTETWKRKARAAKRRATMNSTPIKTTRTRSLTGAHQTAVTRPTSTPILLTNNKMNVNVPSVNRNANVAPTSNKAKPQSPKPPAARMHESPKRAGTCTGREEMIKSIQLTMKPQKNLTETNGNGDNDDADAWE